MDRKTVIALDCAQKTGWAVVDINSQEIIESGVQDLTKKRGESNGLLFLRFRTWLKGLIDSVRQFSEINLIIYEQAHFRGGAATEIGVGLQTRVQEAAQEFKILDAPVKTNTLKKYWTGSGAAGKERMIEKSAIQLGRAPIDDNEADAVAAAYYGINEFFK